MESLPLYVYIPQTSGYYYDDSDKVNDPTPSRNDNNTDITDDAFSIDEVLIRMAAIGIEKDDSEIRVHRVVSSNYIRTIMAPNLISKC